ncbi:MAG: branched-chain amino acid ABC transporter permease [Firmicutes bacterium]|nr:branched-chain amino acid ABC transporter permease [Bacillota bacterium]
MLDAADAAIRSLINPYYYGILVTIGINIVLALSLNLVTGFTGQLHLGHAAFMAIGAYTAGVLATRTEAGFWVAVASAAAAATLFGIIVGLPTLRLRGDYLAIATLGFGEIVRIALLNLDITGGPFGLRGIPRETNLPLVILVVAVTYLVLASLVHSRIGRALIAIREDEVAAAAMGIETTRMKVTAFTVAAAFAGIAGALFAFWFRYLNPSSFGFAVSIEMLAMVVLGGLGNLLGAVLGAAIMTMLPEALRTAAPAVAEHRMVLYGALLVVVMILRPNGLLGTSSEHGWLEVWLRRYRAAGRPANGPRGERHGAA